MRIPLTTALALALAACGQPSSTTTTATSNTTETTATTATTATTPTTTTTASTVTTGTAGPTAASLGLQPGKWETRISVTSMEINGVSRAAPSAGDTVETCLTPEMAAKGPGEMLKKAGVNCTTTTASYSGGRISAQMTCKLPMGTMTSNTTGTYSPTAMTSDADATMTGRMSMREKIHTEARRVGECG
ncbi:DUF3617 domain-containing protein [Sphingomonas bacterium]|uniref:DUF3617 domain-containing protein n=1 Tax=Sphingomonas bacterium TaxID=1895847 RepID=UPI00260B884D|nr:DUF3617 domain-containing protein [Sphingomonas bacterium]MDB5677984.1 hypothetical protein [Sphingomonas bacterium]